MRPLGAAAENIISFASLLTLVDADIGDFAASPARDAAAEISR